MIDSKKVQEREELHKAIWSIAEDLRGSVDGWDFKSYVLGTMFYRYISENLTEYINKDEIAAGNEDFDYAKLSDEEAESAREDMVKTKGFFILPSELFVNVCANAENNMGKAVDTLVVKEAYATSGPQFKRMSPRAKGSGNVILKKTSHITIVLDEVVGG